MPNEKNLMPIEEVNSRRTPEQHSADSRKAGIASGIARRRKRSLREAADLYLSIPVADRKSWNKIAREGVDPEDIDNQMAMIIGLTQQAMKGDAKAAKVIVDLIGDVPEKPEPEVHSLVHDLAEEARRRQQEAQNAE